MKRVQAGEFEKIFGIDTLRDPAAAAEMKASYDKHGIVCIALGDKIDLRLVVGQMLETLLHLPYSDKYMLNLRSQSGRELHIKNRADHGEIITELIRPTLTKENLKRLEQSCPPHREFGAPCTPPSFHNPWANLLRQDPEIYNVATELLGYTAINCDLNRSIYLLPGQGQQAMLHWDCDPREQTPGSEKSLQGKVCFTPGKFICVPGTHTKEFLDKFYPLYDPLYPGRKMGQAKYGLDPAKEDPLDLFGRERAFAVPGGSLVLWNTKILHGHPKLGRDECISFGCYLGFGPEISAEDRAVRRALHRQGAVPRFWPSGDRVHPFPVKYGNFPDVFESMVIKKLSDEARKQLLTTRVTLKGKIVPDVHPWGWRPGSYTPFEFTTLGRRIVGLDPWDAGDARPAKRPRGPGVE